MSDPEINDVTFKNILGVVTFLNEQGFRLKKSTAYLHSQQGKIRPQKDGLYHVKDVMKYANTFLRRLETGQKVSVSLEKMQEKRLSAETKKLEAQALHWEIKAAAAQGFFVERGEFERALAQRAAVFKNDIETFIRAKAPEIIKLVGGQADKTPDLIDFQLAESAEWLNRYAADKEFAVPGNPAMLIKDDHRAGESAAQLPAADDEDDEEND